MLNATIIVLLTISAKTRAAQLKTRVVQASYKWHWLQSEGKYGQARGLAAIICGARERLPIITSPAHKPTDIPFFPSPDVDAYSRIPFCLREQWGSDRLGNIGGLPESEGPTSINWPDLVQIKPQSSTDRHRAG